MELVREDKKHSRKILPICNPIITLYTKHAHILSIIGNYEEAYLWIFSNYIQLYMKRDYKDDRADFYFPFPYELGFADNCRWIQEQKINRNIIHEKWGTIINFIIDYINSNNYIHTMINYFYLSISKNFNKNDFHHDILVYGYDLDEKVFYTSDFSNGGKYTNKKISFSDFSEAFYGYNLSEEEDYLHGMVRLYEFNKKYNYIFNIKNIINNIKEYLSGNAPEYWNIFNYEDKEDTFFGVKVFCALKEYIEKAHKNDQYIDIRPVYMIYDHTKLMHLRMKYLIEKGYFRENNIIIFKEIEDCSKILVQLIIKYNLSKNNKLVDRIIKILNYIREKECSTLSQYVNDCTL